MYKNGNFDSENKPNYKKAIEYFKLGIEKENVDGYLNLANLYENELGVEKNEEKLKELYLEASELESDEAMMKLGILYEKEEDFENAKEYYEKAAAFENPDALYRLGIFYKESKGVEQNLKKSFAYFKEAKEIYEEFEEENDDSEHISTMLIILSQELEILLKNDPNLEHDHDHHDHEHDEEVIGG